MQSRYDKPNWTGTNSNQLIIEVIKDGQIVQTIDLFNKESLELGSSSSNDLICLHPSISRQHCIIQFNQNNQCYIYDNNSTHGLTVNNQKVQPKTYVDLQPGSIFKLGQSKRMYVISQQDQPQPMAKGSDQQVISNLIRTRDYSKTDSKQKIGQTILQQYKQLLGIDRQIEQDHFQGVTWGISDEKEVYDYQNDFNLPLDIQKLYQLQGLDQKQQQKIQNYAEKQKQYEKVKQQANYKKNEDMYLRLQNLENEYYQAEQNLRISLFDDQKQINLKEIKNIQNEDTFDDDFYDRTEKQADKKVTATVANRYLEYSYEKCKSMFEQLLERQGRINRKLLDSKDQESNDDEDELDKFMRQNRSVLEKDKRAFLVQKLKDNLEHQQMVKQALKLKYPQKDQQLDNKEPTDIDSKLQNQCSDQKGSVKGVQEFVDQKQKKVKMQIKETIGQQLKQLADSAKDEQFNEQKEFEICAQQIREEEREEIEEHQQQAKYQQMRQKAKPQKAKKIYTVSMKPTYDNQEDILDYSNY